MSSCAAGILTDRVGAATRGPYPHPQVVLLALQGLKGFLPVEPAPFFPGMSSTSFQTTHPPTCEQPSNASAFAKPNSSSTKNNNLKIIFKNRKKKKQPPHLPSTKTPWFIVSTAQPGSQSSRSLSVCTPCLQSAAGSLQVRAPFEQKELLIESKKRVRCRTPATLDLGRRDELEVKAVT